MLKNVVLITVLISVHKFSLAFPTNEKLLAVSSFEGMGTYYKSIFETPSFRQVGQQPSTQENPNVKRLCKNIFRSKYFQARRENWVDASHVNVVVDERENAMHLFGNKYHELKVVVDGEERSEFLLTCFGRQQSPDRLKTYFISPVYNVNSAPLSRAIAGRFIFEYDNENALILLALAEEPTLSKVRNLSLDHRERKYIAIKPPLREIGTSTACDSAESSAESDPVCQLEPGEKLRLCVTVMSSSELRKKVNFEPVISNVDIECLRVQVSFRNTIWQKIPHKNVVFEERVIGCRTLNLDKHNQPIVYYVSRGYGVNQVFVYKHRDGKTLVKDWMTRVSVVKY